MSQQCGKLQNNQIESKLNQIRVRRVPRPVEIQMKLNRKLNCFLYKYFMTFSVDIQTKLDDGIG